MFRGLATASTGYSQAHTSTKLAAQAASSATVSVTCTRSQEVCRVIFMARKTSGDSTAGVSHDIFPGIQDSFTTQGLQPEMDDPPEIGFAGASRSKHPDPARNPSHTLPGRGARGPDCLDRIYEFVVRRGGSDALTGPTVPRWVA
jgi:hypothetical protein